MKWLTRKALLVLFLLSPLIVTVIYAVVLLNLGVRAQYFALVVFLVAFTAHVYVLSAIRRSMTTGCGTLVKDCLLFGLQLALVAAGVTCSILSLNRSNSMCRLYSYGSNEDDDKDGYWDSDDASDVKMKFSTVAPATTTAFDLFPKNEQEDDDMLDGLCASDIVFVIATLSVLVFRCIDLEFVKMLRDTGENKRRTTVSPMTIDPRIRVTTAMSANERRDTVPWWTMPMPPPFFEEGVFLPLGPPPMATPEQSHLYDASLPPPPSYDLVSSWKRESIASVPPMYEP